jgi:hypothetical protein
MCPPGPGTTLGVFANHANKECLNKVQSKTFNTDIIADINQQDVSKKIPGTYLIPIRAPTTEPYINSFEDQSQPHLCPTTEEIPCG